MSNRRPDSSYNLCNFTFANGKSCAMPASSNGFCVSHSFKRPRTTYREDDLARLFRKTNGGEYISYTDINHALGILFDALGDNRVSSRRAATLAYIAHLMMRSQVGARYEAEHYKDEMHIQQLVIQAKYPGIHGEPGTPFIDPDAPDEDQSDEAQESADVETSVDGIQTAEEELATDALAGVAFADEAAQGRN